MREKPGEKRAGYTKLGSHCLYSERARAQITADARYSRIVFLCVLLVWIAEAQAFLFAPASLFSSCFSRIGFSSVSLASNASGWLILCNLAASTRLNRSAVYYTVKREGLALGLETTAWGRAGWTGKLMPS